MGVAKALSLPERASVQFAVGVLGNGHQLISSDTVPLALWCAARPCAIVGGIVALTSGRHSLPDEWLRSREILE